MNVGNPTWGASCHEWARIADSIQAWSRNQADVTWCLLLTVKVVALTEYTNTKYEWGFCVHEAFWELHGTSMWSLTPIWSLYLLPGLILDTGASWESGCTASTGKGVELQCDGMLHRHFFKVLQLYAFLIPCLIPNITSTGLSPNALRQSWLAWAEVRSPNSIQVSHVGSRLWSLSHHLLSPRLCICWKLESGPKTEFKPSHPDNKRCWCSKQCLNCCAKRLSLIKWNLRFYAQWIEWLHKNLRMYTQ